jgi:hypothetical protein
VDDSGNTTTEIATVSQPSAITLNVAVNLNAITANATGGTGVLEYSLGGQIFQTDNNCVSVYIIFCKNISVTVVWKQLKNCTLF